MSAEARSIVVLPFRTGAADDLEGLGRVRERQSVHRGGFQAADLVTAPGDVAAALAERDIPPGQALDELVQSGVVRLQHRDGVRLLGLDEEAGQAGLGEQCVEGDHVAFQVERGEEGLERGDFRWFSSGLHAARGRPRPFAGRRGDGPGCRRGGPRHAAFAVHSHLDRPLLLRLVLLRPLLGAFAQVGADGGIEGVAVQALQDAVEGGLGGRSAGVVGFGIEGVCAGAGEPVARQVGSPPGDRGQGTAPASTAQAAWARTQAVG